MDSPITKKKKISATNSKDTPVNLPSSVEKSSPGTTTSSTLSSSTPNKNSTAKKAVSSSSKGITNISPSLVATYFDAPPPLDQIRRTTFIKVKDDNHNEIINSDSLKENPSTDKKEEPLSLHNTALLSTPPRSTTTNNDKVTTDKTKSTNSKSKHTLMENTISHPPSTTLSSSVAKLSIEKPSSPIFHPDEPKDHNHHDIDPDNDEENDDEDNDEYDNDDNLAICCSCYKDADPLILCDACPRSYCLACLHLEDIPTEDPWFCGHCPEPIEEYVWKLNYDYIQSLPSADEDSSNDDDENSSNDEEEDDDEDDDDDDDDGKFKVAKGCETFIDASDMDDPNTIKLLDSLFGYSNTNKGNNKEITTSEEPEHASTISNIGLTSTTATSTKKVSKSQSTKESDEAINNHQVQVRRRLVKLLETKDPQWEKITKEIDWKGRDNNNSNSNTNKENNLTSPSRKINLVPVSSSTASTNEQENIHTNDQTTTQPSRFDVDEFLTVANMVFSTALSSSSKNSELRTQADNWEPINYNEALELLSAGPMIDNIDLRLRILNKANQWLIINNYPKPDPSELLKIANLRKHRIQEAEAIADNIDNDDDEHDDDQQYPTDTIDGEITDANLNTTHDSIVETAEKDIVPVETNTNIVSSTTTTSTPPSDTTMMTSSPTLETVPVESTVIGKTPKKSTKKATKEKTKATESVPVIESTTVITDTSMAVSPPPIPIPLSLPATTTTTTSLFSSSPASITDSMMITLDTNILKFIPTFDNHGNSALTIQIPKDKVLYLLSTSTTQSPMSITNTTPNYHNGTSIAQLYQNLNVEEKEKFLSLTKLKQPITRKKKTDVTVDTTNGNILTNTDDATGKKPTKTARGKKLTTTTISTGPSLTIRDFQRQRVQEEIYERNLAHQNSLQTTEDIILPTELTNKLFNLDNTETKHDTHMNTTE